GETSIAAEQTRLAAIQQEKEEALRRDLRRSRRFAAAVSGLLVIALAISAVAWYERGVAANALIYAESTYQLALDQATGGLQLLKAKYDAGSISTEILQSIVDRSRQAVPPGPPAVGDTNEVLAARIRMLDVVSTVNLSIGNGSTALESAKNENDTADYLVARDPNNLDWRRLWAIARGTWSAVLFWQC